MKFTVKSMVLAAMLVAGSANAAAIVNVDQASGSDVFLAVYDYSNSFSSVFDLGSAFSFSAVTNGTAASQTFDLSADASWTSLVAASAAKSGTLQWGIFAGAKTSSTPVLTVSKITEVCTATLLGATGKMAGAGSVIINPLDTFANVVTYTTTANAPTASTLTTFDALVGFKLSSAGVLTYTALPVTTNVPEFDTFAMLLAGLGVMGFVARRRLVA